MLQPPLSFELFSLTDWLESVLLFQQDPPPTMSAADIQAALEGINESDLEGSASDIQRAVQARHLSIQAYPIQRTLTGYERTMAWTECLSYSFLLLASLHHHYPKLRPPKYSQRIHEAAELFERLSAIALGAYVSGEVERFAEIRRPPVPRFFGEALMYLSECSGESVGAGLYVTGDEKDDGVDLLAWRPFPDRRPGQLMLFGQCAIGLDWNDKFGDLIENHWRGHMFWHVYPGKAFMVPFHHEEGELWRRSCGAGGIIFDRLRLAAMVGTEDLPGGLAPLWWTPYRERG